MLASLPGAADGKPVDLVAGHYAAAPSYFRSLWSEGRLSLWSEGRFSLISLWSEGRGIRPT